MLADGQQFVAYAIHPDTKAPYTWPEGDPLAIPFFDLPEVTEDQIVAFLAKAEAVLARFGVPQKTDWANGGEPLTTHRPPPDGDPARRAYCEAALADEVRRVATAAQGGRNDSLNIAALKLGHWSPAGGSTATASSALWRTPPRPTDWRAMTV